MEWNAWILKKYFVISTAPKTNYISIQVYITLADTTLSTSGYETNATLHLKMNLQINENCQNMRHYGCDQCKR